MDDINDLLLQVRSIANSEFDGHFSILKFTTNYKSIFGTVLFDGYEGRDFISAVPGFLTLNESLVYLIQNKINVYMGLEEISHKPRPKRV
jgi:hypothetical protein